MTHVGRERHQPPVDVLARAVGVEQRAHREGVAAQAVQSRGGTSLSAAGSLQGGAGSQRSSPRRGCRVVCLSWREAAHVRRQVRLDGRGAAGSGATPDRAAVQRQLACLAELPADHQPTVRVIEVVAVELDRLPDPHPRYCQQADQGLPGPRHREAARTRTDRVCERTGKRKGPRRLHQAD